MNIVIRIRKGLFLSVSVVMIGFLITSFVFYTSVTQALTEDKLNLFELNSYDRSSWKWTTTEVVSTESTSDCDIYYPASIASDSEGNIHVAWADETNYLSAGTDMDIFYKRWNITTSSWTTTEVISTESSSDSKSPSLAVDLSGNIHVSWDDVIGSDRDIFYKRWNASTSSWDSIEVVSTESGSSSRYTSMAVDSLENVYVAWEDGSSYAGSGLDTDIFCKKWNVTTNSWSTTEVVSTESTADSNWPSLDVDSIGNIHITWHDLTNYDSSGSDQDIFYKRWNSSSESWTTTEVVSTVSTDSAYLPSLDTDSFGNVHIAWDDYTDYSGAGTDPDIFYRYWDASTFSWKNTEVVSTESTLDSYAASLKVDKFGDIHIAWEDFTNYASSGDDTDVFYKYKNNLISSWTTTKVVSTESANHGGYPALDIDSFGTIHINWLDMSNYDSSGSDIDVFYKCFIGPLPVPELADIIPNPTEFQTIHLDWNDVPRATFYLVYRSTSFIYDVVGLFPLAQISESEWSDFLISEGEYFYAVVAGNSLVNSPVSNCVSVIFDSPYISEYAVIPSLFFGIIVVSLIVIKIHRKRYKEIA